MAWAQSAVAAFRGLLTPDFLLQRRARRSAGNGALFERPAPGRLAAPCSTCAYQYSLPRNMAPWSTTSLRARPIRTRSAWDSSWSKSRTNSRGSTTSRGPGTYPAIRPVRRATSASDWYQRAPPADRRGARTALPLPRRAPDRRRGFPSRPDHFSDRRALPSPRPG